ncbi:hypothetical protein IGI04_010829 [Brassica rapa subsp. trilocularis]|uniref:Uncharacterized protein n=1 Tax=Brassica rapa subsp. trilocularis TaxID=1813537 RepID=A0ABQ7N3R3_BRACM|nr:hypothetical protein IGI04_010829 [Brassica rapa subsp. trilocularis]
MDVYGLDDLLDFSNEDIFSASSSTSTVATSSSSSFPPSHHDHLPSSADHSFLYDICVPSDNAANLEWLSPFVDDSFADFLANPLGGTLTSVKTEPSFHGNQEANVRELQLPSPENGHRCRNTTSLR